jgi:hypothetical protein
VEEIPRAYVINGGRLFLDLSAIGFDQEISIALAGDGLVTLGVANDAHVTTVTRWPMEGLGELMDFDGLRYMYERPGRGPLIFIEGYGPSTSQQSGRSACSPWASPSSARRSTTSPTPTRTNRAFNRVPIAFIVLRRRYWRVLSTTNA